jgi:phosphate starvation-inducible PhoH-like protein
MPAVVSLDGDNTHLANLCGPLDENLRQLADGMGVTLSRTAPIPRTGRTPRLVGG